MANLETLRTRDWANVVLPEMVSGYPSMLWHDERKLLHWIARDVWEGWGEIVDAGCFLGGSTVSLATGLRAREQPPERENPRMWTYDLFEAEQYEVDYGWFERWPDVSAGKSFRSIFDELVGELAQDTTVHEGDITEFGWGGQPIEILFLDVLKTTGINDRVLTDFMPSLVPGRSVVIQQDFVHGWLPWIHITMELLGDVLEEIEDVKCSRVYAVTGHITAERLSEILPLDERVPLERQRELMEQAVQRSSGAARGSLMVAQVNLLRAHGHLNSAEAILTEVERDYSDMPIVAFDIPSTRRALDEAGGS